MVSIVSNSFFLLQSHSMSLVVKITQTNRGFLVVAGMSKCSKCKSIGIRQRSNNSTLSTEITPYFHKCLFVKPNYYLSNQFYIYPNLILGVFLIVIFFVWWNRTEIICKQWFVSQWIAKWLFCQFWNWNDNSFTW